ncbi:hypothetical protein K458DRAFT_302910 [Lentithecium fluviatile CBS 122367]|uniref:Uncharacterized protein n=1 Tax=Lentithecium fluviatile CBS 122367 TaxID=1168545 RepID=A0A6G1J1E2_9PLEO|nr:hypothetical protein K458DRAFT_302910 [Lentithecium fluviatile CBS 122367]
MRLSGPITTAAALACAVSALPKPHKGNKTCPPFNGNFSIKAYQVYPENADFDFNNCKLYVGQIWNASLGIYDPYTSVHTTIEFLNISHNPSFHLGAVGADRRTGHLFLIADAAMAFPSEGKDISGTNWLMQYDPVSNYLLYKINLTETSQGKYGGFQDVEHDPEGNVFVVGTWPGTLLRVDGEGGEVREWYLPEKIVPTEKGIGGIAALGWILLAQGDASGKIWRFNMNDKKGVPYPIPITRGNHTFGASDAIYLLPKYKGTVLLVAEDTIGISVFRSKDAKWDSAEFLGLVPRPSTLEPGTNVVAPVQVGDAVYMVVEQFGDEGLGGPGTAGNRAEFPFLDITAEVEKML